MFGMCWKGVLADSECLTIQEWNEITQQTNRRFIVSMQAWYQATVLANGGLTRYWRFWLCDFGVYVFTFSQTICFSTFISQICFGLMAMKFISFILLNYFCCLWYSFFLFFLIRWSLRKVVECRLAEREAPKIRKRNTLQCDFLIAAQIR